MNYMELNWDEKLNPSDFQKIAAFSGPAGFDELETTLENEKVVAVNHHVKVYMLSGVLVVLFGMVALHIVPESVDVVSITRCFVAVLCIRIY